MVATRWLTFPLLLTLLGCASSPSPPPMTANPVFAGLIEAASWPKAEEVTIVLAGQQYLASRRYHDGYMFFHARAAGAGARPIYLAFEGLFQAEMAGEVPLLQRVAWVDGGVAKLDTAVARGGALERFVRGLCLAELPVMFHASARAIEDLEYVRANKAAFDFEPSRAIDGALASAYRNAGQEAEAAHWQSIAGAPSAEAPFFFDDRTISASEGFRFSAPKLVEEDPRVLVAEGYDFANLAFVRTDDGLVAIDSATAQAHAAAALDAARRRWGRDLPVQAVVLTHSHWDHVGGIEALRGPGVRIAVDRDFGPLLERVDATPPPFAWFFGDVPWKPVHFTPTDVVDGRSTLELGGARFTLVSLPGGETSDGLLAMDERSGVAFVGDAFMPYVGAPWEAEGSAEGLLETIHLIETLAPHRLVHGHPPLTRFFKFESMHGLGVALTELLRDAEESLIKGDPVEAVRARNIMPASLRETPSAALPYLLIRDGVLDRFFREHAGYWRRDGEIDTFTDAEISASIDLVGGGDAAGFARAAARLVASGDYALARRIAQLGLLRHPDDRRLQGLRRESLDGLRSQVQLTDPFRFIVYSQLQGVPLVPVKAP